ncbi:MAG: SDR family oxidoreductase [Planctomycetes bacterium]|nr:SDR family oxidoreductase [Planctomycetota bacterium]
MARIESINPFSELAGTVAVVTGAYGVLGKSACLALARAGVKVGVLGRKREKLDEVVAEIAAGEGEALALPCDVLNRAELEASLAAITAQFGHVDHLLNYAGGNRPDATALPPERQFFDLPKEGLQFATDLNIMGTYLPCQVFGKHMADRKRGNILNISSMAAYKPLTRVVAYSAAKAAITNFTQWLSVHMAQEYGPAIRVNALAPGFFLTEQNRFLLTEEKTGQPTARGKTILAHTPQGRFGEPTDLDAAMLFLLSPAARFVTGVVLPVDGGFSAFGGV